MESNEKQKPIDYDALATRLLSEKFDEKDLTEERALLTEVIAALREGLRHARLEHDPMVRDQFMKGVHKLERAKARLELEILHSMFPDAGDEIHRLLMKLPVVEQVRELSRIVNREQRKTDGN